MLTNKDLVERAIALLNWAGTMPEPLHHRDLDAATALVEESIERWLLDQPDEELRKAIDAAGEGWDEDDLDQYSVEFWEAVLAKLDDTATA